MGIALTSAVALAAGGAHTCALRASGTVRCWGANDRGQLGIDLTGTPELIPVSVLGLTTAIAVGAGEAHTCAVLADGTLLCWGANADGQVGDGTTTDRDSAVEVPSFRFNIDPAVALHRHGRTATVPALANCPAGLRVDIHVAVSQDLAAGEGSTHGRCTGALARYPVRVHAQGHDAFIPGPAEAEATIRDHRTVVETQEWTRAVDLEVTP